MNSQRPNTLSWLTTVPAGDANFKATLAQASVDEVREALERTRGKPGHTTRTKVLERRLRKLEREAT